MGCNQGGYQSEKHGVSFLKAKGVFVDPKRVIAEDVKHKDREDRFFCIGEVDGGIMTVRFTYRDGVVRIFGAGYWRKGKKLYETQNKLHR